jgi:hypothetical protein
MPSSPSQVALRATPRGSVSRRRSGQQRHSLRLQAADMARAACFSSPCRAHRPRRRRRNAPRRHSW